MATVWKWACGAIAAAVMAPAVFAQSPREDMGGTPPGVSGYAIEGQTLLRASDFTRVVAPFVGHKKTATDVSRAREALQQTYHDLGHCSVRVDPAYSMSPEGVATFRVTEIATRDGRDCLPMVALEARRDWGNPTSRGADDRDSRPQPVAEIPTSQARRAANSVPSSAISRGVVVAAYVEGAGDRGLTLALDNRRFDEEQVQVGDADGRKLTPNQDSSFKLAMSDAVSGAPAASAPSAPNSNLPSPTMPVFLSGAEGAQLEKMPTAGPAAAQVAQAPSAEVPSAAPAAAPKFEIRTYVVEGNTLLKREKIDRVLAPFTGKNKDFGDVQRALEALQSAYQDGGYGSVEIRIPEQELERGEVKFVAVEAKIGKVVVEGNEHFTSENIRRSVPTLREGVTPNSQEIAQSIRLANENPAKQSTVLLKGAEQEGQIDATIRVADIKTSRYSISLDNTGNENTGSYRVGLAYQNANLFDRDHVLTAQYLTSPQNINDVSVYGLGYRIPLYSYGDSIDLVAGYSNVNSGTVQDLFNVTGKGTVYALRYNQGLKKWGDIDHKLTYGLDYRAYQNNVKPVGGTANLVPDITVHPFSLTYLASLRAEERELSVFLSFVQNLPGMNDGTDDIFKKARFQVGKAGYRLYRFGGSYSRPIVGDWQARIRLDSQYTDDSLVTGEQFAIGGADNVRGFNERFASNDKGYRTNWEIYSPDWGKRLGMADGRVRFLAFYDTGSISRNQALPGEHDAASLDSLGLGVRASYKNYFTARMDVAHILHDGTQGLVTDGRRNLNVVHFSTAWVW